MVQKQNLKRLIPLLKIFVSIVLIILLFKIAKIDPKKLKDTIIGINPLNLVLACGVMFFIITLAACRWRMCLIAQGIDLSIGNSIYYSLIGFFFNNFAPSTVGGDVAKGVIVSRFSKKKLATAISIVMDRLVGLLSTGILAVMALLASFTLPLDKRIRLVILLFAFIVIVLIFLIFHKGISHRVVSFLSSHRLSNVAQRIKSVSDSFYIYRTYPKFIKKGLGLSFMLQAANIFVSYLLALGLGIKLSFLYFLVFIPLIMTMMAIPVSLNGLGLREGAYVGFFSMAGVSKEGALALSFTYYAVVLILSLIGGILLLYFNLSKPKKKEEV